jgi:ABC-2 type transport system permease protein
MYRFHVVHAIFWRNFKRYFTSILGYLFIFVFVTVCAILTFNQQFFADNLVSLDQLSTFFPALLLFFIPAVTMSVWADEKKQGTDAILFTLPASDLEILMGKYKAVVSVYTVALLFSSTTLIALWRLGNPDWGVIAATYFGYWLAGIALASIGMFASSLTSSTTVAFVVGAILCAIPVMIGYIFEGNRAAEIYGVGGQLRDFSLGLVSLPGVVYFLSIAAFMLYLNYVVISRRHWSRGRQASLGSQFLIRVIALALALCSINLLADRSSMAFNNRVDLTSESLFTLDDTTRQTIAEAIDNERPVTIQAFLSPEVPRQFVNTRKNLIGILRQYDRLGGPNIDVRFVNVEPNSKEVEEALSLGLQKQASRDTVAGRVVEQDVFMGAVVTSTMDEIVLPFIEGDTSIEYQLTRSIATATAEQERLKIGVLKTDAHFDNLRVEGSEYDWVAPLALAELRRQYEVVSISAEELAGMLAPAQTEENPAGETPGSSSDNSEATSPPDVLIVADPSSLTATGLNTLIAYIKAGNPTLVMADPLPFYWSTYQGPTELGIINAPTQPRISPQAAWSPIVTSQEPKADAGTAASLMQSLGVQWEFDTTVWSVNNPHVGFKPILPQRFGDRWVPEYGLKETLFVFAKSYSDHQAFNPENPISSGLHELMFIYPGSIEPTESSQLEFDPLVILKPGSAGHLGWDELTEDYVSTRLEFNQLTGESSTVTGPEVSRYTGHNIRTLRKRPALDRPETKADQSDDQETSETTNRQVLDDYRHILAAQIRGKNDDPTNVVLIADIDFISDMFFQQKDAIDTALDNFTFFVNAIEVLANDESFVRLRNRRQTPRTLTTIEGMKEPYRVQAVQERDKAEAEVDEKLADAQARAKEKEKRLSEDTEMSNRERQSQMIFNQLNEGMRLNRQDERIQRDLEKRLTAIKGEEERSSRKIESRVRWLTILSAGLPALILGSIVLLYRTFREKSQIDPQRRVKK